MSAPTPPTARRARARVPHIGTMNRSPALIRVFRSIARMLPMIRPGTRKEVKS